MSPEEICRKKHTSLAADYADFHGGVLAEPSAQAAKIRGPGCKLRAPVQPLRSLLINSLRGKESSPYAFRLFSPQVQLDAVSCPSERRGPTAVSADGRDQSSNSTRLWFQYSIFAMF
jgi:hypothetical protein